jgi:hypothetical protein
VDEKIKTIYFLKGFELNFISAAFGWYRTTP